MRARHFLAVLGAVLALDVPGMAVAAESFDVSCPKLRKENSNATSVMVVSMDMAAMMGCARSKGHCAVRMPISAAGTTLNLASGGGASGIDMRVTLDTVTLVLTEKTIINDEIVDSASGQCVRETFTPLGTIKEQP